MNTDVMRSFSLQISPPSIIQEKHDQTRRSHRLLKSTLLVALATSTKQTFHWQQRFWCIVTPLDYIVGSWRNLAADVRGCNMDCLKINLLAWSQTRILWVTSASKVLIAIKTCELLLKPFIKRQVASLTCLQALSSRPHPRGAKGQGASTWPITIFGVRAVREQSRCFCLFACLCAARWRGVSDEKHDLVASYLHHLIFFWNNNRLPRFSACNCACQ